MIVPHLLLILHEGFEEIETVVPLDLIRRAELPVTIASLSSNLSVLGAHHISLIADCCLSDLKNFDSFSALLIPGGPGVFKCLNCTPLLNCIRQFSKDRKLIATICAAPLLLKYVDVLPERLTAHPCVEKDLPSLDKKPVVVCRNFITANGPAAAFDFAFEIIRLLGSNELVFSLKKTLNYNH